MQAFCRRARHLCSLSPRAGGGGRGGGGGPRRCVFYILTYSPSPGAKAPADPPQPGGRGGSSARGFAMKFTLSWLKEHLDTEASLAALVDRLTMIGLEVESVADKAAALAPFTIARVISAEQHPNADRLRV